MNEDKLDENQFVMNEYIEVDVKQNLSQLCSDCYRALGWTIMDSRSGIDSISLKLKRNRKIRNRVALCDLQRKCEAAFRAIEKLEKTKASCPLIISLGVGLLGTAFMAGAVFAYLASNLILCILLAVPGFIGWGAPYLLFQHFLLKANKKTKPLIDSNYDIIYESCEKASQLINR